MAGCSYASATVVGTDFCIPSPTSMVTLGAARQGKGGYILSNESSGTYVCCVLCHILEVVSSSVPTS